MSARYRKATAELAEGRSIRASLDVENGTANTWRPAEGFAFGYHVFDP